MRVSTSMIFQSGVTGIQNRQYDLHKLQNQLSTGRRVLSPEDDPIASSESLQVTQSKELVTQYLENQANAQSRLTFLDSTLAGVNSELQNVYEKAVAAGNGALDASQRKMIAEELKRRMENLIGLANTQDGSGQYIFSGYQANVRPFQLTANTPPYALIPTDNGYVRFNGDSGQDSLQVSASKVMAVSESGLDVFMKIHLADGSTNDRSLFDGLQNMINTLDGTQPFTQAAYTEALGDIKGAMDHISTVRASVGARQQGLDALSNAGEDAKFLYESRLSALQDLDYADAISRFSNYQVQLEAAQLSFKQINGLSLFNIL